MPDPLIGLLALLAAWPVWTLLFAGLVLLDAVALRFGAESRPGLDPRQDI